MTHETSSQLPTGSGSAFGRTQVLTLILLALLCAFHLVNNWLWQVSNVLVLDFDRPFHLVSSQAYYEILREGTNLRGLFSALTWSDYYPPLIYLTVTLFYKLFGLSMDVAAMSNSIYLVLYLLAIYDIGKRVGGPWVGLLAAFVTSTFPIVFSMSRYLYIDFALASMVAINICLLLRSERFQRKGYALLYGLSFGLGMLTKWTFLPFVAAPLLVVLVSPSLLKATWQAILPVTWNLRRLALASCIGLALTALWFLPNIQPTADLPLGYALVPLSWLLWTATAYSALTPSDRGSNLLAALTLGISVASAWYLTKINFVGTFWLNAYGKPTGRMWGFRGYLEYLYREHLSPVYTVLLVLAIGGLIWFRWQRTRSWRAVFAFSLDTWVLIVWAAVPYFIFSIQVSIVHSRYIMPLLPPLGIAIALWLFRVRPPWIRSLLNGVLIITALLQFIVLSFDGLNQVRTLVPIFADGDFIQLPASGRTDPRYWVVPDILQYIEDHRDTEISKLGILVNEREMNSQHFIYLVYADYPHVLIQSLATMGSSQPAYPRLFESDYALLIAPPPHYARRPDTEATLKRLINSPDDTFHRAFELAQTYPWPDGRQILLYQRRFNPFHGADLTYYEALMAELENVARPEDGIVVIPPEQVYALARFGDGSLPLHPLPTEPRPFSEQDLEELAELGRERSRLWVVLGHGAPTEPVGMATGWLAEHFYQASSNWYGPLQILLYAPDTVAGSAPPYQQSEAVWDAGIKLLGYRFLDRSLPLGQILRLELQWQTIEPILERYKVFVHVLNNQGQLVAQRDSEPGSGTRPMTEWTVDEPVTDRHGLWLPADLPDGEYQILMGLYDPETLERAPLCCPAGDSLGIGRLRVESGIARLLYGTED